MHFLETFLKITQMLKLCSYCRFISIIQNEKCDFSELHGYVYIQPMIKS